MPPATNVQRYICVSCVLKISARNAGRSKRVQSPSHPRLRCNTISATQTRSFHHSWRRHDSSEHAPAEDKKLELSDAQIAQLGYLRNIQKRMQNGLSSIPSADKPEHGVSIEVLLSALKPSLDPSLSSYVGTIEQVYSGQGFDQLNSDLEKVTRYRTKTASGVEDENVKEILAKLGVVSDGKDGEKSSSKTTRKVVSTRRKIRIIRVPGKGKRLVLPDKTPAVRTSRRPLQSDVRHANDTASSPDPRFETKSHASVSPVPVDAQDMDTSIIPHTPIDMDEPPKVPELSFDLSRVLFNPGVYQLQDPRSRVFNFDPYLADIMPVQQFDFDALNQYITSSEDDTLRNIALQHKKRYIGSSSSMSGVLSHFHFLLSAWRPISISTLSHQIPEKILKSFTTITRAPAAVFLRWRNGVYGVDADKEYDTGNILMILGRSMEKLLTLDKSEFEKFRIQNTAEGEELPKPSTEPEAFHYAASGDFLLRSQLDAYDPRLPGTGMFDLKTRAVAGIRMNMDDWQTGMNYQIKDRVGLWESYEREYYDMIRAAFLKYSLQVRMGRMDGIFVAYHNIARIFGFQYISLPELDQALHGQTDQTLGDREFRSSIKLMNEIFDEATEAFPEQTLRFYFETKDATDAHPNGYMQIFAETISDEEADKIQSKAKTAQAEFERQALGHASPEPEAAPSLSTFELSDADQAFIDEITKDAETSPAPNPTPAPATPQVASWRLTVYNEVNGKRVTRPADLSTSDRWHVKYKLERRSEKETLRLYNGCKNRRASALEPREGDRSWYIRKIVELSLQGKAWREQQDRLDAEKSQVVLYPENT